MIEGKDSLFAKPLSNIGGFAFDEKVPVVFKGMIRRSVPGYALEAFLVTETIDTHLERLRRAGFSQIFAWMQCLGLASFSALK